MNKSVFLANLKNKKFPAEQNEAELSQLADAEFDVEDNQEFPIEVNNEVFNRECAKAEHYFTQKRCQKLIELKKKLQKIGAEGFTIQAEPASSAKEQINVNQYDAEALLMDFVPNERLKDAVVQKDIGRLRSLLMADINNNRLDIREVLQTIFYIYRHAPEVFEAYTISKFHPEISQNEADWNYEYFMLLQSYLNANFALERLLHLYNIRDYSQIS
ncbi:hypothetical protein [Suttonella ornithocola]|uniref:Uncharacterized protein n=1 Tax=Suttonella ornithocola TaxID=279832 RepID=A0A380MZB1_9GAMM|nr:hypothetical protein [Suttonella ornithocola]SUO97899.1 Uncharacterised protein [Suttonella ornithocola]